MPVSLQLWSLRDAVKADFARTVQDVARMGFAGVETAGFGSLDAAAAAKAVADAGLRCSGMHVGWAALRADLPKVAGEAHLLGARHVICPAGPREVMVSAPAFRALGEELDEIGRRLRAFGLDFHYHNHGFDLVACDGRPGLDWMLDAARPAHLGCEADIHWLQAGGVDPVGFIRAQGRRIRLIHLRDDDGLGTGPVDFAAVFAAIDAIGAVEWQVLEVEKYRQEPLESVRRAFAQLQAWGRA
jgi:sugar phosphate isomerase/epimerase